MQWAQMCNTPDFLKSRRGHVRLYSSKAAAVAWKQADSDPWVVQLCVNNSGLIILVTRMGQ